MKRNYNLTPPDFGTCPAPLVISKRAIAGFTKRVLLTAMSLFILSSVQTFAQQELCIPQPDYVDGKGIVNVNIGSINNFTGLETPNYGDYTLQTANVGRGTTYPINITLNTFSAYNVRVWVDWNNNNNFEITEQVFTEVTENGTDVSGNIAVPAGAALGNHRMRVGITPTYAGSVIACYTGFDAAAYEDYTLNVTPAPTCFIPGRPVAVNNGQGIINISWTAPATGGTPAGYEYAITSTPTIPNTGTTTITATSVTGITVPAEVRGYIYIRTNCGGGNYSEWISGSFYNGVCIPAPDSVNGEGITNVTIGTINKETLSEEGNYGNYSNLVVNVGQGVTQPFSITFSTYSAYAARIWVDWNNDLDFDDDGELVYSGNSQNRATDVVRGTFTVPVNASLGNHRLRVGGGLTFGQELSPCLIGSLGTFEDYTVNVTNPPSCFTPLNPTATSVAFGVANLSWTAPTLGNNPSGYEYVINTMQDAPVTAGTPATTASAQNVAVTANAINYIHVRTHCSGNDYSDWMTATYYNGYCTPEPGYVDGDGITNFTLGTINNTQDSTSMVYYTDYTNQVAAIGQGVNKQFNIGLSTSGPAYRAKIWIDWNNDLDFDDEGEEVYTGVSAAAASTVLTGYINVPLTATMGNHRLRIGTMPANGNAPTACSRMYYGEYQDYTINVIAPPSCYTPDNFAASSQSSGLVTISWNAPSLGGIPAGYQYSITQTATPGAGTNTTATTINNVVVTPNSTSYLHVRTNCGGDDYSEWVTVNLYNGYCIPAPQTVDNNGITSVVIGSINNPTNDQEVYSDFTSLVANIGQSVTQQFSIGLFTNNPYAVKMWIDFNDDLVFEDSEMIYEGTSAQGIRSIIRDTFTIPANAPLGNHRLRIAGTPSGNEVTPCDIRYFGVYEDYTINVTTPPTCYTPLSPAGVAVGPGNATLTWTAPSLGNTPAGYEYAVTTSALTPATVTAVTGTTVTSFALAQDDTYYYLHVRTNCGNGDYSEWVISEKFRYLRGETCQTAVNLATITTPYTFNTEDAANNYRPNCGNGNGGDIYYYTDVLNGYTLNIGLTNSDFQSSTSLFYGSCNAMIPVNCTQGYGESLTWENTTGTTKRVYCVVDGDENSSGNFTMEWSIAPPPSCNIPRSLNVSLTTVTSGTATWTVPNTGTPIGYEYAVTTSDSDPETFTYTTATSALVTVTANVDSYLHVRAVCGETDKSDWVTYTFFSGYCNPLSTVSQDYYISGITTTGGLSNFTNSTPVFSAYTDYTATHAVTTYAGGSFAITATTPVATDIYLYGVWIDWNNDYDFTDEGERVINTNYLTSPASLGNIAVPAGIPVGTYRMRVRTAHTGVLISPCDNIASGNSQDYTLNITATPTCFPPVNPVIIPADATTASLTWIAPLQGNTPSGYEYVFGPSSSLPTEPGIATNAIFIFDAVYDPAQSVYLFVRSTCGEGQYSDWARVGLLGINVPQLPANNVIVYKDGNAINIKSNTTLMTGVAVYDTRGRMLYTNTNINTTETTITDMQIQQQVIIVEVTTAKGKVSKRIVF